MDLDWNKGGLAAGLACYRNEEFFDAHEHWEEVWRQLQDPEKNLLQGLIQVTVAMHHYRQRNMAGARILLERAMRRFERCSECIAGIDVEAIRTDVLSWRHALESESPSLPAFPRIHPVAGSRE